MAMTNHERVGKALELLKTGPGPFVDREIQGAIKAQRVGALRPFVDDPQVGNRPVPEWGRRGAPQADSGNVECRLPRDLLARAEDPRWP